MATQIKTRCEHCGQALGVPEEQFGSSVCCPMCHNDFVVSSVHFAAQDDRDRVSRATSAAAKSPKSNGQAAPAATPSISNDFGSIGRFEILDRLGGGTYGVVYHAYDPLLDRQVALKIPRIEMDEPGLQLARRFESEAKAAARLRHPGIVSVFETGKCDGQYYIASEFVEGATLRTRIEAGTPAVNLAARWIAELAKAIDYAHAEGVVHRDLKPDNILLDINERPQILDFGLAKRLGEESSLTTEGSILGTPAYMSPEQARGDVDVVGPASDQYSLGTILYELLTGQKPFHGAPHAVVAQVSSDEPPHPRSLNPNVPRDLEAICRQAMEKSPSRRYSSCGELADDLERWLSGRETMARPLGLLEQAARWSRRRPAAAFWSALFAATFLIAFSLVAWQWRRAETLHGRAAANFVEAREMRTAAEQNALELKRQRDLAEQRAAELGKQRNQLVAQELALKRALAEAEQNLSESLRQKKRADETSRVANRESERAEENLAKANRQQQKAQELLAGDYIDLGLRMCEEGQVGTGVLWLARSLSMIPKDHPSAHMIRANLGVYRRQFHQLSSVMQHESPVVSADNLAGSLLLLTGCEDGSVHLWDAAVQTEVIEPLKFAGKVTATAVGPAGKFIFISTTKTDPQIFSLETGKPVGRALKHPAAVLSADFSADGKFLLTGCTDRRARVWGTKQGRLISQPMEHPGEVNAVAFSPNGKRILTGTAGVQNQVSIWNPIDGKLLVVLGTDTKPVRAVDFSPNGEWMAAGGDGGGARIWNAKSGKPHSKPCETTGALLSLAFSPDSQFLLTGSAGQQAQLWRVDDASPVGQSLDHSGEVRAVAFAENGRSIATADQAGNLRIWWNAFADRLGGPLKYDANVLEVDVAADGRSLATASDDRTARIWDLPTGLPVGPPLQHAKAVTSVAFSPDGKFLASGSRDHTARLWDVELAQRVTARMDHDSPLTLVRYSPSGQVLLAATENGTARLWNVGTGKSLRSLQDHRGPIVAAAFSPDGRTAITGSSDRSARLWDVSGAKSNNPVWVHDNAVTAVAFCPDGMLAATASSDRNARVWDSKTSKLLHTLQHVGEVSRVAFHPGGRWLLTAATDGSVLLWDADKGTIVRKVAQHPSPVVAAEFSHNGLMMLTADRAGTVQLMDTTTGRAIGALWQYPQGLKIARFTPTDGAVIVVSASGQVIVRPTPFPVDEAATRVELWAQVITGQELDDNGLAQVLIAEEILRRQKQIIAGDLPVNDAKETATSKQGQ